MQLKDSLSLAFRTVRSNKLRTGITVAIIAFGIMALIGIITAITSMNQSLSENFATMGANSFSIVFRDRQIRVGGGERQVKKTSRSNLKEKKSNERKIITYQEAKEFKQRYTFPARLSISIRGPQSVIVSEGTIKTNPNISMTGADENYLAQNGYALYVGRNFNQLDVQSGRSICIVGNSLAQKFFGSDTRKALDQVMKSDGV
jgi:putative ABC transport system permease protein